MAQIPKQLSHIGTSELVDFPDDAIFGVPAKIDTGADYSAIWASDITLDGDMLKFNFFAPGSPHYQPESVKTSTFKQIRIKNSFGDVEDRYKIKLRVQIGSRKLVRWFSLADRSRNTYPVLLGKNFLKNTFVVDVSARHIASEPLDTNKILVLGAAQSSGFFRTVAAQMSTKADIRCASYDDLVYYIDDLDTAVLHVDTELADIAAYNLVYFKSHNQASEFAAAAAEYLTYRGRRFFDKEVGSYTSMSKLSEYMRLTCGGLPVPKSICAVTPYLRSHFTEISTVLGLPFVLKESSSDKGKNNFLIHHEADYLACLDTAKPNARYIAQKFIPSDGFYRIYVVGKRASLAIWRASYPHKNPLKAHLNKPAGSVNATNVVIDDVAEEAVQLAKQAAECMNRQIAGVDLIQDSLTGSWYVLEVNNAPQLRSGSFIEEKAELLAELLDKELNR